MSIKIFISYSHKDQRYLADDSLLGYLKGLEKEDVEFWWDEKISAGEKWDKTIRLKLEETNIALVLVSQRFLDSPYCADTEISSFLKNSSEKGLIIIPVILSACEWNRHDWLASRQFFPGGHETVEEHYVEPGKEKRLFAKIRESIRTHVEKIKKSGPIGRNTSHERAPQPHFSVSGINFVSDTANDSSLADIFKMPDISKSNNEINISPWLVETRNKIVPADFFPTMSVFSAMKFDWDLADNDSCNGLLTVDKLKRAIDKISRERDDLIRENSNVAYITSRLKDARQLLKLMEEKMIDALDYMPEHMKELPAGLKYCACEILMNDFDWVGRGLTQESIDKAKYRVFHSRLSSTAKEDRIKQIKEIAEFLELVG